MVEVVCMPSSSTLHERPEPLNSPSILVVDAWALTVVLGVLIMQEM